MHEWVAEERSGLEHPPAAGAARCWSRCFALAAVALSAGLGIAPRAPAEENASAFLEALRSRGYYDTATEYLEQMRNSPLVGPEFKAAIPYEEAVTRVRQAASVFDAADREVQLNDAIDKFAEFTKSQPNSKLIPDVKIQIGNIYIHLARAKLQRADGANVTAAEKTKLREEARKLYDTSFKLLGDSEKVILATLNDRNRFPRLIPASETELLAERNEWRKKWMSTELLMCLVTYETSRTFEPGSKEQKEQLGKAAAEYEKMYDKHVTRPAGLFSRIQQGKCLQEKGDHEEALDCFVDFLAFDPQQLREPTLRMLHLQALRHSMVSWIALKKLDEAIAAANTRLSTEEAAQPDWLAIRFYGAQALKAHAESLKDKRHQAEATAQAVKMATAVANIRGEFQLEARKLLDALGRSDKVKEPENFAEARERAQLARQKWQIVRDAYQKAPEDKKKELQKDLDAQRKDAIKYYQLAISFTKKDTPVDQLNLIYYGLCYLYLDDGNPLAAAVVGEHLARNFPDAVGAKDAAYIAMIGWLREYVAAPEGNRAFESDRIASIGQYMIRHWPDAPESAEAGFRMLHFAIAEGNVPKAIEFLAQIPTTSARRGEAELLVGVSLWRTYLGELRKPVETRPSKEKLAEMRAEIEQVLSDGVKRMQSSGTVDGTLVGAVLSLAQLYIDTNRPKEALQWLEDKKVGSLALIASGNPSAQKDSFKVEAYKVALRSYIGVLPSLKNDPAAQERVMKKAEDIMNKLEEAVGKDETAGERLTQVYIAMGKELEGQLLGVRDDPQAREALSSAFEEFLTRIVERPGNTYNALIWVAETFYNLGSAADTGERPAPPAALKYFAKAATTYEQILTTAESKPDFLPNEKVQAAIQMRLALSFRRMGEYNKALDLLAKVLKAHPWNLGAQVEAALTLQDAGAADPKSYEKAILGDRPQDDGKKLIWGWTQMARYTVGNPKLENYYFEAHYRATECRVRLAQKSDAGRKTRLLSLAKNGVELLYERYPGLGGSTQREQFDVLIKTIQRELGEPQLGLKAFDTKGAATAAR